MHISSHPVLLHKLSHLRDGSLPPREFRRLLHEVTLHLGYEATAGLSTKNVHFQTPVAAAEGERINEHVAIVPILRAGLGMCDAMLELMPNAAVHHIGMYRLPGSELPVQYYNRLPKEKPADIAFVLDPLIASSITLQATVAQVKAWGAKKVVVISVVGTEEGLTAISTKHPDVQIHLVSGTDTLNDKGKMVPGIGDSGDRQFDSAEGGWDLPSTPQAVGTSLLKRDLADAGSKGKKAKK